jgi:hypothetical protein
VSKIVKFACSLIFKNGFKTGYSTCNYTHSVAEPHRHFDAVPSSASTLQCMYIKQTYLKQAKKVIIRVRAVVLPNSSDLNLYKTEGEK